MQHIKLLFLSLLLLLVCGTAYAQQFKANPKSSIDSVKVKGDRFIFIEDSAFYIRRDTVLVIHDTVDFYIRKNNMEGTNEFYSKVEKKMSKSSLSSLVYDAMFAAESKPQTEEFSEQRFIPYEREVIADIGFKKLPVFGSDVTDTTVYNPSKWTAPFNKIHLNSQNWAIKRNLTFKKGEVISPRDMVDSERLLRRQDYIKDARVMIHDHPRGDSADVVVVTQDVFPINFIISPSHDNEALFGISTINIGGIGHELEYDYIRDGGSDFFYKVRNIQGTFIDVDFNYARHFRRDGYGAIINKEFVTQETKYAGGGAFNRYEFGEYNYEPTQDTTTTYFYDRRYANVWLGRAFRTNIVSNPLGFKDETNAVASIRIEHANFYDRPEVRADTNYRYHDKTNYLVSLGLTSRKYYKDKFILQFGRTEDIPSGSSMGLVFGYQTAEFNDRFYAAFNYARGGYIPKIGYVNGIFSLGGYVNGNGFEDGIVKIGGDYFTKLFSLNQLKIREFVDFTFTQALFPDEEYILSSERDLGIRGVRGYFLRATTKFNLKVETLVFTPFNVIGFRMACFAFVDYTMTKNIRNDFFDTDHFMGIGGGIRLRNDNLAFSTIQLRLAYYPSTPINASGDIIGISTSTHLDIRDFDFNAPEIVPFN